MIATRDRADRLVRLLSSLWRQSRPPDEVLVVDDGSTDSTPEVLRRVAESEPRLRVLRNPRAAGPASARERGWRAARGELIAFTDDDCVADPAWLEEGSRAWQRDPAVFVQGRTEPVPEELENLGPFSRTISVTAPDPAFQTCNMLYPRELLERIDGFDTETFGRAPGGEDCDLAWRAIEAGARPAFGDLALVHHAVNHLGPLGKLRVAARWTTPMLAYARHPRLRATSFTHRVFWKEIHYLLARAVVGVLLPARLRIARMWLIYPYLQDVWARARLPGGNPLLIPYFMVHDLVEVWAVARAAARTRTPML